MSVFGLPSRECGELTGSSDETLLRESIASREEIDNSGPFNFTTRVLKVPGSVKRPMQTSDNPVCKTTDVDCNVLVDFGTPGRDKPAIFVEAVDRLLAELADEVDGTLDVEALLVHDNRYHVVGISF